MQHDLDFFHSLAVDNKIRIAAKVMISYSNMSSPWGIDLASFPFSNTPKHEDLSFDQMKEMNLLGRKVEREPGKLTSCFSKAREVTDFADMLLYQTIFLSAKIIAVYECVSCKIASFAKEYVLSLQTARASTKSKVLATALKAAGNTICGKVRKSFFLFPRTS